MYDVWTIVSLILFCYYQLYVEFLCISGFHRYYVVAIFFKVVLEARVTLLKSIDFKAA